MKPAKTKLKKPVLILSPITSYFAKLSSSKQPKKLETSELYGNPLTAVNTTPEKQEALPKAKLFNSPLPNTVEVKTFVDCHTMQQENDNSQLLVTIEDATVLPESEALLSTASNCQSAVPKEQPEQANCSQNTNRQVFVISDSPSPATIDLTSEPLSVPRPKRVCLIDLTESPVILDTKLAAECKSDSVCIIQVGQVPAEMFLSKTPSVPPQQASDNQPAPCTTLTLESEMEMLLWQRGITYSKEAPGKCKPLVRLFTPTQNSIVETVLEHGSVASRKLHSAVAYLRLTTNSHRMPKASLLLHIWEMVTDPHVASNHLGEECLLECASYFHSLLSIHPPGQHREVDNQYSEFLRGLGTGGWTFQVWEEISNLISGLDYHPYIHLLSFLVDLLLADYWETLRVNGQQNEPLFKKVFWHHSKDSHITMPIRQLLDITLELFANSTDPEISKVDSCMCLLFLVGTHCTTTDLATELTIISRKLPQERLRLFLSSLKPQPLRANVTAQVVPKQQNVLTKLATLALEDSPSTPVSSVSPPPSWSNKVPSVVSSNCELLHGGSNGVAIVATLPTESIQFQAVESMTNPKRKNNTGALRKVQASALSKPASSRAPVVKKTAKPCRMPPSRPRRNNSKKIHQCSCENCNNGTCARCQHAKPYARMKPRWAY